MGAWGTGILQEDFAADIYGDFMDAYDGGQQPAEISAALRSKYAEELGTPETAASFWLALAKAQWECAHLEPAVLAKVQSIARSGDALVGWDHEPDRKRRLRSVAQFAHQLEHPPKRIRRPIKHRAPKVIYDAGTCLSVALHSGGYGAAIVLEVATQISKREIYTLVGALRGRTDSPPPLSRFEARDWLVLSHHNFKNEQCLVWCASRSHKEVREAFAIVGATKIRPTDPKMKPFGVGVSHSGWGWIENQIRLQADWDTAPANA